MSEKVMAARIRGLEKNEAPWHLRWFYRVMRKMFGKDLTPAKIQIRVPAIFFGHDWNGSRIESQAAGIVASGPTGEGANSGSRRVSFLNRCQFCRRQEGWIDG